MKNKISILLVLVALASGCASTTENLSFATAREISGTRPQDVIVSDVKRGMSTVTWVASEMGRFTIVMQMTWFVESTSLQGMSLAQLLHKKRRLKIM